MVKLINLISQFHPFITIGEVSPLDALNRIVRRVLLGMQGCAEGLTFFSPKNHPSRLTMNWLPGTIIGWLLICSSNQLVAQRTYCNPVNIDYTYMSHYAFRKVSYRSGADPAVINFKGRFYMFVTRSHGYWYSDDMSEWHFVKPQSWYFNGSNAPAAAVYKDEVIVLGDPSGRGAVIRTDNPELGDWQTTYSVIPIGIQDPDLFVDGDQVFLYEESSNVFPIRGVELDPENFFLPKTEQVDLFKLNPEAHGWERFGQDHKSDIDPFIEGPWMTRHKDTYYLEYSAPGTQWNVYADGVYTAKSPLGPFTYAPYNPVSYKPGGFLTGAGHGSTVRDNQGEYWHFASMPISVNYKFERRIGMFPAGFEADGQLYVNTAYGDFPHYLPNVEVTDSKNRFTGWMLLSKDKKVTSNSVVQGVKQKIVDESDSGYMPGSEGPNYQVEMINDENIRTMWVAGSNSDSIFVEMDLGSIMTLNAIQINYQDFNANIFGRPDTLRQQFTIEISNKGKKWQTVIDYSDNQKDMPHAYLELDEPVKARFIRFNNKYFPNKYLAISELRIFGSGGGKVPLTPRSFTGSRQSDDRNADLKWKPVPESMGYVLYWGIKPDRLNNAVMIYDKSGYEVRALNKGQPYYFQVEAFNENGISKRSSVILIDK